LKQCKKGSLKEANINTFIALPINYILNFWLIGLLQDPIIKKEHWAFILMTTVFTIVSITRNYIVRRIFANKH